MVDLFGDPTPPTTETTPNNEVLQDNIEQDNVELSPRNNPELIGHSTIEQELLDRINTNKLPHALILHGPKGIGKSTLSFRLARYLFKQSEDQGGLFAVDAPTEPETSLSVDPQSSAFKHVASAGHPDLFTVEIPEGKSALDVEQIRKIVPFMRMTSNTPDGWRIVIVDDADTMNINAQNALLKILEEPPEKAILILVTHRIGSLIPTIRSRCQDIAVKPLNTSDCKTVINLLKLDHSPQEEELFLEYCDGAPGTFAAMVEEGGSDCIQDMLDIFKSYPNFDPKTTHRFADNYGGYGKDKSFKMLQSFIKWIFRTLVTHKVHAKKLPFLISDNQGLKQLYDSKSYETLLQYHDQLAELMTTAQIKNLDKRNTLLQMFFLLQK